MNNIMVVKFGGSCLSDPDNIRTAAERVHDQVLLKKKVIVVVSALSGVTDQLLNIAEKSTSGKIAKDNVDEILSMGERTAVRILSSSLKSLGVEALEMDPTLAYWPIFTDSTYGNANIDLRKTQEAVNQRLLPLLKQGKTPVVAGFLGLSPEGKITTLGRGGSDLTALLLGNCVNAEEVIFVKDVTGIFSADPKKVVAPQKIDSLSIDEAYTLAIAGAKILQPKALQFKKASTVLRIVGLDAPSLTGGTIITGELKVGLITELAPSPLSMVTLITHNSSLSDVSKILSVVSALNGDILGLTVSSKSILLYVLDHSNLVQRLHDKLKQKGIAKAVHWIDSLAMITVSGSGLEDIPGVVNTVVSPLAMEKINLYGVFTISSSIRIFIPWSNREKALSLVRHVLLRAKEGNRDESG